MPAKKRKHEQEEDLEALFDRIAAERQAAEPRATVAAHEPANETLAAPSADGDAMFQRLGQLTRALHDSLRELGFDRKLAQATQALPDARDRLDYIALLSGQAAERVLSAVERGQAMCTEVDGVAVPLASRWDQLYAGALSVEAFKTLAADTRAFLAAMPARTGLANGLLHEIMMTQDVHDRTGQVIARVAQIAHALEKDLLAVLIETGPPMARPAEGLLSGPPVPGRDPAEVANSQAQVDELLDSLGF